MTEKAQIELEVKNDRALKAIDQFNAKLQTIGKQGLKASKDLEKSFTAGLSRVNNKIASEFTRDFNKNLRETAKGSGDTFAKGFGQSLRKSLQPQLTQLKKDIDNSVGAAPKIKTVNSGAASTPSIGGNTSGFSAIGAAAIVANQSLELLQKGFRGAQIAYQALTSVLNRGQEVISLNAAFDNLQASVGRTDSLNKFREATKGLVSDLDLFRSANQAVILGVDKGDESFLQLTSSALKLGRAMGIDAKASIDSLVIGIGRQSKLVLDNLGVIVQAEKAYDDYARALKKTADELTDSEKKLAFYDAAVKAILESASLLPDIAINAGDAFTQLGNKAENAFNEFARGVSENQNLTSAISDLSKIIDGIDFTRLGNEAAELAAKFLSLANTIISNLAPAFDKLGEFLQKARESSEIKELAADYEKFGFEADKAFVVASSNYEQYKNNLEGTKKFVTDLVSENIKLQDSVQIKTAIDDLKEYAKYLQVVNKDTTRIGKNALNGQIAETTKGIGQLVARMIALQAKGDEAGETVKKKLTDAEKAAKKFKESVESAIAELSLFGNINPEIDAVSQSAKELADRIYDGTINAEELKLAFQKLAQEGVKAGLSVKDIQQEVNDGLRENIRLNDELQRQEKQKIKQFKEVLKDYESTGTGKFRGTIDSLFGTNLVQETIDATGGDPKKLAEEIGFNNQLEQTIAQVIADGINGGFEEFGSGQLGSSIGGAAGGLLGSYFGPIGATIGQYLGANIGKRVEEGINEVGDSTDGTIRFLTTWVDLVFFGIGTAIQTGLDSLFDFSPSKEELARKGLKEFLKRLNEETKGFSFFDGQQIEGLKPSDLAALELPQSVTDSYRAIGEALKFSPQLQELAGELDGIGMQFGDILALNFEGLNGGLNDLQLLLVGSGLSAETFGQSLEDAYFKGTLGAGEFLSSNAAIQDLFANGIPGAIGAVDISYQNFRDNALRSGQDAQDSLRDIVAEAKEFGAANNINIGSLEDISGILTNNFGFSVDQVTQLMNALAQQSIDTVEELENISVLDTANVVNNLQGVGFGFRDVSENVDETIKKIDEFKKTAGQEVVTNWKINVKVDGDKVPNQVAEQTNFKSISAPSLR